MKRIVRVVAVLILALSAACATGDRRDFNGESKDRGCPSGRYRNGAGFCVTK